MKKVLSLILVLIVCLSLCACGDGNHNFDEEYTSMINRVEALNSDTSRITEIVYGTWSNVGVSNFNTFFNLLLSLTEGTTLDSTDYSTQLGPAACCLFPSEYWDDDTETARNLYNATMALKADPAKAQKVLDAAIDFNNVYSSLTKIDAALSADIKTFKEQYGEKYSEEVETLRDWVLESSMYVDYALNPSGSLIEYGNGITEYEENLNRFSKIANAY